MLGVSSRTPTCFYVYIYSTINRTCLCLRGDRGRKEGKAIQTKRKTRYITQNTKQCIQVILG